jgi:GTP1/Obg family GTP-binding protein
MVTSQTSNDSFDEEMKKLARQADRAYEEACQRARKRVQAEEKKVSEEKNAQARKLRLEYLEQFAQYFDDVSKLNRTDPQYKEKRDSLVKKMNQINQAMSALPRLSS